MNSSTMAFVDDAVADELRPYRVLRQTSGGLGRLGCGIVAVVRIRGASVSAAVGLFSGLAALRSIRRYPDELSGMMPAALGITLCGVEFAVGVALHSISYATEVPDGYYRISFADLQPSPGRADLPIPPDAAQLNGKRVFVKGYLYPDGQQDNIKRFVLVPDMGTCCFGGQPKLTDMIEVTLRDPLRTEFARKKRKLGGILKVDMALKPVSGLGGVYYQLTADYLQ